MNHLTTSPATDDQQVPDPRATRFALTPPVGTVFWKRLAIQVADDEPFTRTLEPWNVIANGTWRSEVYVYVSGVPPDDERFTEKGGLVTIVMVNQGYWKAGPNHTTLSKLYKPLHELNCPKTVVSNIQLPSTGSGTQVDKNWQYNIAYRDTLPLFRNNGNDSFQFEAIYEHDFVLQEATQDGTETRDGLSFAISLENDLPSSAVLPINSLSVFRFNDVKLFPLEFDLRMSLGLFVRPASKTFSVDLNF